MGDISSHHIPAFPMKKWFRILFALAFIAAGLNHFRDPGFYLPLIPPYFPWPEAINSASGIAEIGLGGLLFSTRWRSLAGWGIILLLVAFVPAHIYMIQLGGCLQPDLCFPVWFFWLRLIPGQLLLMAAAWWVSR